MDKFCKFCGTEHTAEVYPKQCGECGNITFKNPIPVAVLMVPVTMKNYKLGMLIGRRAIAPFIGEFALIGGYVDEHDATFEAAAARELREETGIEVDPNDINMISTYNTGRGNMLVFCYLTEPVFQAEIEETFVPSSECSEIKVIAEYEDLCFPAHSAAMKEWFDKKVDWDDKDR